MTGIRRLWCALRGYRHDFERHGDFIVCDYCGERVNLR